MTKFVDLQFNQKILKGGSTPTIFHTSVATGVAAINPAIHTGIAPTDVAAINPAVHTPSAGAGAGAGYGTHAPVAHT